MQLTWLYQCSVLFFYIQFSIVLYYLFFWCLPRISVSNINVNFFFLTVFWFVLWLLFHCIVFIHLFYTTAYRLVKLSQLTFAEITQSCRKVRSFFLFFFFTVLNSRTVYCFKLLFFTGVGSFLCYRNKSLMLIYKKCLMLIYRLHLFDGKYSNNSNDLKYYYNLKSNLFLSRQSWIFRSHYFSIQCHMIFQK